jgi:outer membrane receptor protein involved in Fe transport
MVALTMLTMAHAPSAWAQAAPAAPAEGTASEEIIVTGSRVGRTTFNAPQPVNVIGEQRMQDLNITSVGDALNQLPSFRPLVGPATNQQRSSANIAGRSLDLRGLGTVRTLTLLDGRRHVGSDDDGSFDLNSIPSILVQRSEVVTGGASAAYGAGAIAGVVNLILDTNFDGVRAESSYGISQQSDAEDYYLAFKAGRDFAGGRGHVVFGGEYSEEGAVEGADSRDWGRAHHDFIPNPFWNADPALSNGLPRNIGTDNVNWSYTRGGSISVVHPFQGMQFDTSGNLVPFAFGELFDPAQPSAQMLGGDPTAENFTAVGAPYVVAVKHVSALAHVDYELTDSITFTAQVSYADVVGGPTGSNPRADSNGRLRVQRDNAFLTPSTAAMMDAASVSFIPVSRINFEIGSNTYSSSNETVTALFALEGQLGGDWMWDASYLFGQTEGVQFNSNSRLESRWTQAIDAVFAPSGVAGIAPGTIICRSTITDPTNGCVPANIMGSGNVSDEAVAWINSIAWSTRRYTDHNFAANVRGTLFEGWAGPISVATGLEYRTNASEGNNDPNSQLGLFSQLAWTALPEMTQKVSEGYGEINVPLLRDSGFGRSLELNAAVRQTHYSISGDATTWKVGAVYELTEDYMFRVTRSRDIRAPSPDELNPNRTTALAQRTDPKLGIRYFIPALNGGNPDLELETADTFTLGGVFQPDWFPNFRLSLDYYNIEVEDAIDIASPDLAISVCRAGTNPAICDIGTDETGNPDRILALYATFQNISQLHAEGYEMVANYNMDLAEVASFLSGDLNFTVNGSYFDTVSTTFPNGSVNELTNWTGATGLSTTVNGLPRYRVDALVTYAQPSYSFTAHMSYIPEGILNRNWIGPEQDGYSPYLSNSVNNNDVASRFYLDLSARADVISGDNFGLELFGGINNALDADPPHQLRMNGNPLYFDPIGRAFTIGLRADW